PHRAAVRRRVVPRVWRTVRLLGAAESLEAAVPLVPVELHGPSSVWGTLFRQGRHPSRNGTRPRRLTRPRRQGETESRCRVQPPFHTPRPRPERESGLSLRLLARAPAAECGPPARPERRQADPAGPS